ncbi:FHA domain-containing protein [Streptomyces sp. 7N604]|uniref:FHA domain-containing protein n=1 Tax=Streptomyces sp. 7N604 TaxID=3457415 RepID=UPI003FD12EFB
MPTCPNGHQSGSDDWCEVCGHHMAGAAAPAGTVPPPPPPPPVPGAPGGPGGPGAPEGGYGYPNPNPNQPSPGGYGYPNPNQPAAQGGYGYPNPNQPPAPGGPYGPGAGPGPGPGPAAGPGFDPNATAQAELCPQCRTPREAQAPFCEECRYNFLTHSPTFAPPAPPSPGMQPPGLFQPPQQQPQAPQAPQQPQSPDGFDYQSSRPSQVNRPAEPLAPQQLQQPLHGVPPQGPYPQQAPAPSGAPDFGGGGGGGDDWTLQPPAQAPAPGPGPGTGQVPGAPQAAQPAGWVAVVAPDRQYFMAMMGRSGPEAAGLNLPAYSPAQQLPLTGSQVTIGRRRHSTGESPDIDLSRPPEDPGVSHQHAVLVAQPDGSWSVVDQDSTNGTTINGGEDPIQPFVPVPLQEGDRVHVGAWTTITLRRG